MPNRLGLWGGPPPFSSSSIRGFRWCEWWLGGGDGGRVPAVAWALPWVLVHRVGEVAAFWSLGAWVLLFTRPGGVPLFPEALCFPLGSVSFVLAALGLSPAHSARVRPLGCYVVRCGRVGHINQHFTSSGTLTHTQFCIY